MLAMMVAPTVGIDPLQPQFILTLIAVVAISSFGVAGVGGAQHSRFNRTIYNELTNRYCCSSYLG